MRRLGSGSGKGKGRGKRNFEWDCGNERIYIDPEQLEIEHGVSDGRSWRRARPIRVLVPEDSIGSIRITSGQDLSCETR